LSAAKQMRMPELLIFGKVVALGAVLTEVVRLCFLASVEFGKALESRAGSGWSVACIVCALCVVVDYALQRQAQRHAWRVIASWRIDLLVLFCVGSEIDFLLQPQLARAHDVASRTGLGSDCAIRVAGRAAIADGADIPRALRKESDATDLSDRCRGCLC